jgi:hypothetical protein
MSAGLFALSCPNCGSDLTVDQRGTGSCLGCGRSYLNRFGYLIPIELDTARAAAGAHEF